MRVWPGHVVARLERARSGFTMAELLIVVAIVAVLVAIAIPTFSSQLEAAREAVDSANERTARAAAVASYLGEAADSSLSKNFNAGAGVLTDEDPTPYG